MTAPYLAVVPDFEGQSQLSTNVVPLKISALGSTSTKVARVLHYGDPTLDEEIVIPSYDSKKMNLEQINEVQEALEKRKK